MIVGMCMINIKKLKQTPDEYEKRYDFLAEFINRLINSNFDSHKNSRILGLDVGCGTGDLTEKVSKKTKVHFIKLDPEERNKKFQIIPGVAEELPFKNNSFDLIMMISAFEHVVPNKRIKALKDLYRVLKKNGLLLVQMPNNRFPIELHSKLPLQSYLPRWIQVKYHNYFYSWEIDYYSVSKTFLLKLAKKAKFKFLKVEGIVFPKDTIPKSVRIFYDMFYDLIKFLKMGHFFLFKK